MKHFLRTHLFFVCAVLVVIPDGFAQSDRCVVSYSGQTRNRIVGPDSRISAECGRSGWPNPPVDHSPPFGNWGVTSNYGHKKDSDQFAGWKRIDGKLQWNSCTTLGRFAPPNPDLYNYLNNTAQKTVLGATGLGTRTITYNLSCEWSFWPPIRQPSAHGCLDGAISRSVSAGSNFTSIYELDKFDADQLVTTLYFRSTSVQLTNCNYYGCPERTSNWVGVSRSTRPATRVSAELRTKASMKYAPGCSTW